jgi:hypothetical protein
MRHRPVNGVLLYDHKLALAAWAIPLVYRYTRSSLP